MTGSQTGDGRRFSIGRAQHRIAGPAGATWNVRGGPPPKSDTAFLQDGVRTDHHYSRERLFGFDLADRIVANDYAY